MKPRIRAGLLVPAAAAVVALAAPSVDGLVASASAAPLPFPTARSHPKTDPYYPNVGTTTIDALHYGLDLTWDGSTRTLAGTATILFRATRDETQIALDMGQPLQVSSVTLDGVTVTAAHDGSKLDVATGALQRHSVHTLSVSYQGEPAPVPAPTDRSDIPGLGWTVTPSGQAWSLQEPYGAYTWFPVNDHPSDKAFYDITWHTKAAWRGVSNGELVSDTVTGGERTMHWRLGSPAASYLVTVGIGPYRSYQQTGPHHLPITYWVRDANKDVLPTLRKTPAMLRWLEARLGRFPFGRIGDIVVPTDSGEETQTLVTLGPSILRSRVGRSDLLHEYAHQWYGDEVTPNNWKDLWLNETFAMYVQIRWEATHHVRSMRSWRAELQYFDQRLRHDYGPPGAYRRHKFAELNVYYCGARMLDRLHSMLGHKTFGRLLRRWPHEERFRSVGRAKWVHLLNQVSGRHLGHFVHHWLMAKQSPK